LKEKPAKIKTLPTSLMFLNNLRTATPASKLKRLSALNL